MSDMRSDDTISDPQFLGSTDEVIEGFVKYSAKIAKGDVSTQEKWNFLCGVGKSIIEGRSDVVYHLEKMSDPNVRNVLGLITEISNTEKAQKFKKILSESNRTSAGVAVTMQPMSEQISFLASCGKYAKRLCQQIDNAGNKAVQAIKKYTR
jgi:hypothetical protein